MRQPLVMCSAILVTMAVAVIADAATLVVSPTGTATAACTRDAPCDLTTGATTAKAGDTVILLDGIYKSQLVVANSGTASDWITFQADDCATPIIEGTGVESDTGVSSVDQPTGVGSSKATYVRFVGLVSRGWNSGFGNGWTGERTTTSNGHFEFKYCIGDGNGRTGFTFFSAEGVRMQNCISAHNGSSVKHSWSSGFTLYEAQGTSNVIEGCVSFENMDAQQHTDGSGFIADESSNDATFINNIAFRNGGSCLRLTSSSGVKFINNTCYHNAQDPQDTGPTNPGEIYFTNDATRQSVTVKNNCFFSTGSGPGAKAVAGQPTSGWANNVVQDGGTVSVFSAPEGSNPDFTLASSASTLIGKGTSGGGAPTGDIGFDPKCIVKKAPTMLGNYPKASWWQYSVDIEYIKSIGGVAKCFRPKTRSGTPDIGAYANGAVTATTVPCKVAGTGGASSTGGTTGSGGTSASGTSTTAKGGTSAVGGTSSANKGGATNGGATNGGATNGGATSSANKGGSTAAGGSTSVPNTGTTTSTAAGGSSALNTPSGGANSNSTNTAGGNTSASGTNLGGSASSSSGQTSSVASGNTSSATPGSSSNIGGDNGTGSPATSGINDAGQQPGSGCGCRVAEPPSHSAALAGLALLGLSLTRIRRRRAR